MQAGIRLPQESGNSRLSSKIYDLTHHGQVTNFLVLGMIVFKNN